MTSTKPIRVLVVDDSAFMRKAISNLLSESRDFVVVNTARSGEDALRKVAALDPDVMTLDIDMPGMDGLSVLERVMKEHPLPVVIVSSLTEDGAAVTIRALELGALDFIPKHLGGVSLRISSIRDPLHEKVRVAARASIKIREGANRRTAPAPVSHPVQDRLPPRGVTQGATNSRGTLSLGLNSVQDLVVIGCSTGGPQALQTILKALPSTFSSPIVVAQHMPKFFTKTFAERLNQLCAVEVREAQQGDSVKPGLVLIAPGGQHMSLHKDGNRVVIQLSEHPAHLPYRPSVDILMESAAQVYGPKVIGLVLTGMGQDGLEGARAIKQSGGSIIAQDEASCIVYGMPKVIVEQGCADKVLPLQHIAGELESWLHRQSRSTQTSRMVAGVTTTHE